MRRAVAFVLLGVLAGCGASPPRVPAPSEIAGLPDVTVSLDPQVDAERARVFQQQDGADRLRNAVLDELADNVHGLRAEVDRVPDGGWDRQATRRPDELRTARWLVRQAMHEGVHHLRDIQAVGAAARAMGPDR